MKELPLNRLSCRGTSLVTEERLNALRGAPLAPLCFGPTAADARCFRLLNDPQRYFSFTDLT